MGGLEYYELLILLVGIIGLIVLLKDKSLK